MNQIELGYGNACVAFEDAIKHFQQTRDPAYVFQAFVAWRECQRLYPEYVAALLKRTGATRISDEAINERGGRVLALLDEVAGGLSTPKPRAAQSVRRERIIADVNQWLWGAQGVRSWQIAKGREVTSTTQDKVFKAVARWHGVNVSTVRAAWESHIEALGITTPYGQLMRELAKKSTRGRQRPKARVRHPWKGAG